MEITDKKRSFACGKRKNAKQHKTFVTLSKIRFHAYNTAQKNHRKISRLKGPYKRYYEHMYPTPNCHAHHTRDNVAIVETSDKRTCTMDGKKSTKRYLRSSPPAT